MSPPRRDPLTDRLDRPLASLRISVTDRCNMRCRYCMPEEEYVWLPRESLLQFEEITRLATVFAGLGVRKLRLTGGEPLLRQDLPVLVRQLSAIPGIEDLALTTNGLLLGRHARPLADAGLHRVTLSLDTLRPERMLAFARSPRHQDVLTGLEAAREAGLGPVKLNTVVVRGHNDDELVDLVAFARDRECEVRFIEYMDVGGATRWRHQDVVTRDEMLGRIEARFGPITSLENAGDPSAPADRFRLEDGTVFGIIASVSAPFCGTCDRARLTADGHWYRCLYAHQGGNLRDVLRLGVDDGELARLIGEGWRARTDRGAEQRLGLSERGVLHQIGGLRADPHLEMHTRGG